MVPVGVKVRVAIAGGFHRGMELESELTSNEQGSFHCLGCIHIWCQRARTAVVNLTVSIEIVRWDSIAVLRSRGSRTEMRLVLVVLASRASVLWVVTS